MSTHDNDDSTLVFPFFYLFFFPPFFPRFSQLLSLRCFLSLPLPFLRIFRLPFPLPLSNVPLPAFNFLFLSSWDTRRMNSVSEIEAATTDRASQRQVLDYRWQRVSRRDVAASASSMSTLDRSLVTFTGHSIAQTLVRCDFSPQHSTGSRYAYTGSADGCIHVYDILTGERTRKIAGHQSIVRDVAWQDSIIVSSSVSGHEKGRAGRREERLRVDVSVLQSSLFLFCLPFYLFFYFFSTPPFFFFLSFPLLSCVLSFCFSGTTPSVVTRCTLRSCTTTRPRRPRAAVVRDWPGAECSPEDREEARGE